MTFRKVPGSTAQENNPSEPGSAPVLSGDLIVRDDLYPTDNLFPSEEA